MGWQAEYKHGRGEPSLQSCPHVRLELTLGCREAEHDHSGDGAILKDCPRLQNLCVEGEHSGPHPGLQLPSPAHASPTPCLTSAPLVHMGHTDITTLTAERGESPGRAGEVVDIKPEDAGG